MIISGRPCLGVRVKLVGKWYFGKVVRIRSDIDIEVELDNGRFVDDRAGRMLGFKKPAYAILRNRFLMVVLQSGTTAKSDRI